MGWLGACATSSSSWPEDSGLLSARLDGPAVDELPGSLEQEAAGVSPSDPEGSEEAEEILRQ